MKLIKAIHMYDHNVQIQELAAAKFSFDLNVSLMIIDMCDLCF